MNIEGFGGRSPRDRGRVSPRNPSLLEFVGDGGSFCQGFGLVVDCPLVLADVDGAVLLEDPFDDLLLSFESDDSVVGGDILTVLL